jgi:hypothetical protein
VPRPLDRLYEEDFVAWADETARLLREGRLEDVNLEHLAEEVEGMANRDRRELLNRLTVLIHHLLKWQLQPQKRARSWASTITIQRDQLEGLFEQSPSLRRTVAESVPHVYPRALRRASTETGLDRVAFPKECPFTSKQILDPDFLPDR